MSWLTATAARPLQIAPTEDEQRALQRYRGPREELSPPEQFLLTMCAVPRLDRKVCTGQVWGGSFQEALRR